MTVLLIGLLSGCSSNTKEITTGNTCLDSGICKLEINMPTEINIDQLEIYHFHTTNQCYSCVTIGDYAEETVNTYFKDELSTGVIVFDHIDIDKFENHALTTKYGVTGSSLWLGTYVGNKFTAEENTNVWYKINDKDDYMIYLKNVIEQKLAGN